MSKSIGEILGKTDVRCLQPSDELVLPTCNVGIELELEGVHCGDYRGAAVISSHSGHSKYVLDYGRMLWDMEEDGSLRNNGMEFVSKKLFGQDVINALDDIDTFCKQELPQQPSISDRCSTHIHIDVTDLNFTEFLYFICNYIIAEPLLFNYCGNERADNFYCLPYFKSDSFYDALNQTWMSITAGNDDDVSDKIAAFEKYSSVNISSVNKFGSLEFRQMGGCFDKDRLLEWINILMKLKQNCIGKSPELLPESFSGYESSDYVAQLFGDYTDKLLYPGYEDALLRGVRYVQDVLRWDVLQKSQASHMLHKLIDIRADVSEADTPVPSALYSRYLENKDIGTPDSNYRQHYFSMTEERYYAQLTANTWRPSTITNTNTGEMPQTIFPELEALRPVRRDR